MQCCVIKGDVVVWIVGGVFDDMDEGQFVNCVQVFDCVFEQWLWLVVVCVVGGGDW